MSVELRQVVQKSLIEKYPDKPWDWYWISENKFLYDKIKSIREGYTNTLIFVKELNDLDFYLQHRNIIDEKKISTNKWLPFNKASFVRILAKTKKSLRSTVSVFYGSEMSPIYFKNNHS